MLLSLLRIIMHLWRSVDLDEGNDDDSSNGLLRQPCNSVAAHGQWHLTTNQSTHHHNHLLQYAHIHTYVRLFFDAVCLCTCLFVSWRCCYPHRLPKFIHRKKARTLSHIRSPQSSSFHLFVSSTLLHCAVWRVFGRWYIFNSDKKSISSRSIECINCQKSSFNIQGIGLQLRSAQTEYFSLSRIALPDRHKEKNSVK